MARTDDPLYVFCRALPGVTEDVKWGNNLVFSVGKKMFAAFDLPDGFPFSMKTEEETFELLSQQPGIRPAPYLARAFWITIERRDVLPEETATDLLRDAHRIVVVKLPKRTRAALGID